MKSYPIGVGHAMRWIAGKLKIRRTYCAHCGMEDTHPDILLACRARAW